MHFIQSIYLNTTYNQFSREQVIHANKHWLGMFIKIYPGFNNGLRPSNMDHIFFQLATQYCSAASWKASLHVLPPTSNIVTQRNFLVASWKIVLKKVDASSSCCNMLLQLVTTKFRCVAMFEVGGNNIRATTFFNLRRNKVALQVAAICCSYYFTFNQ